ncbi:hypothetical protein OA84_09640 [Kaistella solincola]|uniref:Uncharacterized protein n=1 Tax=Kaistella solincola TaxID=510955 RepID=A0ABR4ZSH5_9FLAO|nr:hypothetical protein OA84_09640 [Kaistella solincola]
MFIFLEFSKNYFFHDETFENSNLRNVIFKICYSAPNMSSRSYCKILVSFIFRPLFNQYICS